MGPRDQARWLSDDGAADGERVRLLSRHRTDWTERFPAVVAAMEVLDVRSCLIDGEMVACDEQGFAVFDLLRRGRQIKREAHLIAFDLLELDGRELAGKPIEIRKAELARLLRGAGAGLQICEHVNHTLATSSSPMPASLDARASCRSDWARNFVRARANVRTGSR